MDFVRPNFFAGQLLTEEDLQSLNNTGTDLYSIAPDGTAAEDRFGMPIYVPRTLGATLLGVAFGHAYCLLDVINPSSFHGMETGQVGSEPAGGRAYFGRVAFRPKAQSAVTAPFFSCANVCSARSRALPVSWVCANERIANSPATLPRVKPERAPYERPDFTRSSVFRMDVNLPP
jgi:hypothetical protein